jgi:hypothetical protein
VGISAKTATEQRARQRATQNVQANIAATIASDFKTRLDSIAYVLVRFARKDILGVVEKIEPSAVVHALIA